MQVKSQLKEKLNELPTQEELQKKADNFIAQLPNYKVNYHKILDLKPILNVLKVYCHIFFENQVVEELGSSVKEGLASLPTKEEVKMTDNFNFQQRNCP